jgi:4-aminobutyrate aminotransferase-like enzyme
MQEVLEKCRRYVVHPHGMLPYVIVDGKGCILRDMSGKEYIDCMSGTAGVAVLGHRHPEVDEAVRKQLDSVMHPLTVLQNIPRAELAEKLAQTTPSGLTKTYFSASGSDAVEVALKGAMKATRKHEVVSVYNAYHGGSFALMSLGQPWHRQGYPVMPGFRQIPTAYCYRCFFGQSYPECDFECARALEHEVKYGSYNDVAAFIIEPSQGNGGHMVPPDKEYFKIIREICDTHEILLVDDEIQVGFGRSGKMWGCDYFNFKPDIMVVGKALGNGVPISATIFREDLLPDQLALGREWWHGATHEGSPLQCVAGLAVVNVITRDRIWEHAAATGQFMKKRLLELQDEHELIGEVRGLGMFLGVEIVKDRNTRESGTAEADKIVLEALERGAICALSSAPGFGNVVKMKPPLIMTEKEAARAIDVVGEALAKIEREL